MHNCCRCLGMKDSEFQELFDDPEAVSEVTPLKIGQSCSWPFPFLVSCNLWVIAGACPFHVLYSTRVSILLIILIVLLLPALLLFALCSYILSLLIVRAII